MTVTIDSTITRIGGNPPTHFRVQGTVTECEMLHVGSSCTKTPLWVPIPTGALNSWGPIDVPNDRGCDCGTDVTITAYCGLGTPSQTSASITVPVCDSCPQVNGTMSTPGDCAANNTRPVTLTVNFSPPIPTGATASVTWIPGGSLAPTTTHPTGGSDSQTFNYLAGTYYPVAVVAITLASGQVCSTTTVTFGTLTVLACLDCPTLGVTAQVRGCAPTNALVSFNATLTWPQGTVNPPAATAYNWTIDNPGGTKKAQRRPGPASVDTTSGWTGTLATASGAVDLSQPGTYTISVHANVPGVDAGCDPTGSTTIPIPPCQCPAPTSSPNQEWTVTNTIAPLSPNNFQTLACDTATVNMTLAIDSGGYQSGDLRYTWDFGDGSPVVTGQGIASASQPHTFTNPTQGQSRTYTVLVTVSVPGSTCAPFSRTALIAVPACTTPVCPSVNQVTPDRTTDCINPGGTVTFGFTATITNPGTVTGGFQWDFGDGTTQTTQGASASHSYSTTGTFTVRLTVNGPAGSNCPSSSQTTTVTVTRCSSNGGNMGAGCWILLLAALVLGVVACILGIIAACALNPYLGIAAGIVGFVALVLLVLWLIFCARGNCGIFNWARWIVIWILMIAPVVGIIVGIAGTLICGLIATGILWGYWGVVLAILDIAGPKIGCPLTPQPWP